MPDKQVTLSEAQRIWLQGLLLAGEWTFMCASELGNPEVSTLQSLGLVKIRTTTFAGREWIITDAGRAALTLTGEPKP